MTCPRPSLRSALFLSPLVAVLQACSAAPADSTATSPGGDAFAAVPPGAVILDDSAAQGPVELPAGLATPTAVICRAVPTPQLLRVGPLLQMPVDRELVAEWRTGEGPDCDQAMLRTALTAQGPSTATAGWPVDPSCVGRDLRWSALRTDPALEAAPSPAIAPESWLAAPAR